MLSELFQYISDHPVQPDTNTFKYLEACSKIFEKGFLSHDKITSSSSEVLKSIDEGFTFFTNWLNQIFEQGMYTKYMCMYYM